MRFPIQFNYRLVHVCVCLCSCSRTLGLCIIVCTILQLGRKGVHDRANVRRFTHLITHLVRCAVNNGHDML